MGLIQFVSKDMIISFNLSNNNVSPFFGMGTEDDYFKIFFHSDQKSIHIRTIFEDFSLLVIID